MAFWQGNEILIILVVVILLFGAAAIPKLARAMGRAKGEFQSARKEFDDAARQAEMRAADAAKGDGEPIRDDTPPQGTPDQVRQAARDMGIDESKMSLDDVKKALNEMLG